MVQEPQEGTVARQPVRAVRLADLGQLALVLAALWLLRRFVVEPYTISGYSMLPNFADHDRVVVNKLVLHWRAPQRGEVVVVDPPVTHSAPYIKRVVGVPGDEVEMLEGRLFVNGEPVGEAHIAFPGSDSLPKTKLGPGEVWLLGDNREDSQDSRFFGPVALSRIRGVTQLRFWPPGSFGPVSPPPGYR